MLRLGLGGTLGVDVEAGSKANPCSDGCTGSSDAPGTLLTCVVFLS